VLARGPPQQSFYTLAQTSSCATLQPPVAQPLTMTLQRFPPRNI